MLNKDDNSIKSMKSKLMVGATAFGLMAATFSFSGIKSEPIREVQTIEDFYSNGEKEEEGVLIQENLRAKKIEKYITEDVENFTGYINKDDVDIIHLREDSDGFEEIEELTFKIFTEGLIKGENQEFYKMEVDGSDYIVKKEDISKDRDNIFRSVEGEVRYLNKASKVYSEPNSDSSSVDGSINDKVDLKGYNEVGFAKVDYKGDIKYVKVEDLSETKTEILVDNVDAGRVDNSSNSRSNNRDSSNNSRSRTETSRADGNRTSQDYTTKGQVFNASFSSYYPHDSLLQGGFYDALGNKLNPANNTCAAPKSIPFGTKLLVEGTGTDVDGQVFTVTDRGGAIKVLADGTVRIDILKGSRDAAYGFGRRTGTITIVE